MPPRFVSEIESAFESVASGSQVFIGSAEVEFVSFSEGFGIELKNTYIRFNDNINASVPKVNLRLKLSELLFGRIKFRKIGLTNPSFVIAGNVSAHDFGKTASKDFFDIYTATIYGLFDNVAVERNAIPAENILMENVSFSFNRENKYETWKVNEAELKFYRLQDTTYLSTYISTHLFGRDSEVTINARRLGDDKMMLKAEYHNLSSKVISGMAKGFEWFNELQPVLNGTSSIVLDKDGNATSISLESAIEYEREDISGTKIDFTGVLDLIRNEQNAITPRVRAEVALKDVDMKKLPQLWPEKYGAGVRDDVLKNYSKGTFNNVAISFDFQFSDADFTEVASENFAISGDIVNTDIIYNEDFPVVERAEGHFYYDGDNVRVQLKKGFIGKLEFRPTNIDISGINNEKTILEMRGEAVGEIVSLRPLLSSILKGRDKEFFYNTRDIRSDSGIKFYYKDNINDGFDPDVLDMDIEAYLTNVVIKDAVKGVELTSHNMDMRVDGEGLHMEGEADLNGSPSRVKIFVGFDKENHLGFNMVSEVQASVLDGLVPGIAKYVNGLVELEFEYKSEGAENYFTGKIDTIDSVVDVPQLGWNKPTGIFASTSFGGRYIPEKAVEISELQLVSGKNISSGNMIISLNNSVADELYFSKLAVGGNDAEVYFNRSHQGKKTSYVIKVNGSAFNASRLLDSFHDTATGESAVVFDMAVDSLIMSSGIRFSKVNASMRCGYDECYQGKLNATMPQGNVSAHYSPVKKDSLSGPKTFKATSDNAGQLFQSLGLLSNVQGGSLHIEGGSDNGTRGIIQMNDFALKKAPILTKIFSLASFTGLMTLLSGEGIPMKKLKGNFAFQDGYVSITDLRSYGNSLGFTTQGNVNLNNSTVELSGAVTPSYQVNTLLGDVPLIGKIFKGKEGEGLIATSYSVKGKYPEVDVSVNPLSALTPGFLRNIWGGAETDIDKMKKKSTNSRTKKQSGFPVNTRQKKAQ